MWKWLLTRAKKPETPAEAVPESVRERVTRLEIDLQEVQALCQAVWARQRKVEGAVHGARGAANRWPGSTAGDETLDQYRDRMAASGRLGHLPRGVNDGGQD